MSDSEASANITPESPYEKTYFGFWLYLMTDCVLFASLFAVYAVLHANTFGGPSAKQLVSLPYVLVETLALLTSSFTCGLAVLSAQQRRRGQVIWWFIVTFILGATFLGLELSEFHRLIVDGHSWRASGFLSSFFTLVGTHGLHITVGLLWVAILIVKLLRDGMSVMTTRRIVLFSMFWHFLDVIWIFIFTIVYLMGVTT